MSRTERRGWVADVRDIRLLPRLDASQRDSGGYGGLWKRAARRRERHTKSVDIAKGNP